MAVGTAEIHKSIVSIWAAAKLDGKFKAYWSSDVIDEFVVLHDEEAEGKQPFPYCVFEQDAGGTTVSRSSGDQNTIQEYREHPWTFTVQARDFGCDESSKSAKELAAYLAEEVMKVYGGHPSVVPMTDYYAMDNGQILLCQYQTDFGIRTPTRENYSWQIKYLVKTDNPVRTR